MDRQFDMQSRLQSQASDDGLKPYAPTLHEQFQQAQSMVIEQINPNKVVTEVLLELSGQEKIEHGAIKQSHKPYLNNSGLRMVRIKMKSIVNQNTIMSHLKEKEIAKIMELLANDLALDLGINWREYGLKDRNICDTIIDMVIINCYTALKRSQEQNEKNFLGKIAFESINSNQNKPKKDGGFLSKFKL